MVNLVFPIPPLLACPVNAEYQSSNTLQEKSEVIGFESPAHGTRDPTYRSVPPI